MKIKPTKKLISVGRHRVSYETLGVLGVIVAITLTGAYFVLGNTGQSGPEEAPNLEEHGLVGHWNFEEGSGQTISDRSGNGNDGTLGANSSVGKDDPVFVAGHDSSGPRGMGMSFDGTDDYVVAGTSWDLSSGTFTFGGWAKADAFDPNNGYFDAIMGFNEATPYFIGIAVTKVAGTPHFKILSRSETPGQGSSTVNTGEWYNVLLVWDGTDFNLYINGQFEYSVTPSGSNWKTATDFNIGKELYTGDAGHNYWNGQIDSVRVYNRALSADEIRMLYNQKKPIFHAKMDEGSGQTAYDESFNNNDGTIYGAAGTADSGTTTTLTDAKSWTVDEWIGETVTIHTGTCSTISRTITDNDATSITVSDWDSCTPDATSQYKITSKDEWTTGKFGSALDFDGVDDYVDAGNLNFFDNQITISVWIRPDGAQNNFAKIVNKRNSANTTYTYSLQYDSTQHLQLYLYDGVINLTSTSTYSSAMWYHVVATYDGADAKLYVNNNIDGTDNGVLTLLDSTNTTEIGIRTNATSHAFNGLIDDVRIYNYARTADEIRADYNAGKAAHFGENNQRSDSLVGHWTFEEGSGQTISDRSGNGNDGTLGANDSVGKDDPVFAAGHDSNGPRGMGMSFDGVDDCITLGADNNIMEGWDEITVSMWINPDAFDTHLLHKYYVVELQHVYGYFQFTLYGKTSVTDAVYSTTGVPLHIVGRYDGSNMSMYLNGVQKGTTPSASGALASSAYDLSIGSRSHYYDDNFDGTIDDVRIYNRALSADEIRMLYNQKKPIFHAKMDEGSGQTAYDESFNNNDGTLGSTAGSDANDPTWTTGKFGSGLDFDGTDDHIDCGSDNTLDNLINDFTVSLWFNAASLGGIKPALISKYASGIGFDIGFDGTHLEPTKYGIIDYDNSYVFSTNQWYFTTVVFSSTAGIIVYVDGNNEGSSANTTDLNNHDALPLLIGNTANTFNGLIDDVRIYNYARTADEIRADYNAGKAAHLGKNNQRSNGLVGHWNFEEGSGQTISDRSGNGNDGTLGANSSVGKDDPVFAAGHDSNGPEGTGMDFDGVDDYVDCGAVTNLTNTPTTISAWIKLNSNTTNQYIFVQQNSANTGLNGVLLWQPGIDGTGRIGLTANISLATFPYRQSVNNTLLTGTNYHVLATWDGSNTAANIHIYVNGVEVSYADTSNGSGTATASTGKSIIGGRTYDNLRQIDGLIDDVRIYNRALSADEIRMLYNQKKPIFHAKMDEGSGQIAYDESFNDNDGTLGSTSGSDANDPTWTTGKFGSALDFDGVDDYVDAGSDSSLDLSGNMSLFAWAKFDDITSTQQLITQSTAGAGNIGQYGLEVGRTDNEIAISWGSAVIDYSSSNVQTNRWYFIGWTRAGSVGNWKSKIYIDGVLDETRSNIITNPGSQKLLNIGWLNYSIPHYFNGIIDDVRIYNYARTADEILVDYNNGLAARLR